MFPGSIIKKEGAQRGKTLAVFAGIHGNEKAGVIALESMVKNFSIERGTVYFVFANPPAIEKNQRLVHKNLNRLFSREVTGNEYEYARAVELMDVLDTCDALLDLHSYNSETGDPFVIAEKNAQDFTSLLDVEIIAEGFGDMGYGTDDYMCRNGRIGICLECGTSNRFEEFVPFANTAVMQFLSFYGAISNETVAYNRIQKRIRVKKLMYKQTNDFRFSRNFRDFEVLPTDEPYIVDGDITIFAEDGEMIMFPRPDVSVGEEVCIIGEFCVA